MKKYKFNPNGIRKTMKDKDLTLTSVSNAFGYGNTTQAKRWYEGHDIYISKACDFCNHFGLNFNEIFIIEEEDKDIVCETAEEIKEKSPEPNDKQDMVKILERLLDFIDKKRAKEREIFLKETEKIRTFHNEQTVKMRQHYEEHIQKKIEQILEEKKLYNDLVIEKKNIEFKYEELSRQYKELEMELEYLKKRNNEKTIHS